MRQVDVDDCVEVEVREQPYLAHVTEYYEKSPDPTTWASDLDYYGYTEMSFELCDMDGYPAPEFELSLSRDETLELERDVLHAIADKQYEETCY